MNVDLSRNLFLGDITMYVASSLTLHNITCRVFCQLQQKPYYLKKKREIFWKAKFYDTLTTLTGP